MATTFSAGDRAPVSAQPAPGDQRVAAPAPRGVSLDKHSVPQPAPRPPRSLIRWVTLWVKVLLRRPGIAHIVRAATRFTERLGTQFAGAITYFSFLALVPILMVAFSVAGFVLISRPDLLTQLKEEIAKQFPGGSSSITDALNAAVDARVTVGLVGLVIALYSGISWMGNVRAAIQAQWRREFDKNQEIAQENLVKNVLRNLWMLAGLGLAIVISLALSTAGSSLATSILNWLGLGDVTWLTPVFVVVPLVLAMIADVLIFGWIYTVLPPRGSPAPRKALVRGSIMAAVAFELLKFALTYLLPKVLTSASAKVFGNIIGLLFFFNLVATVVLFVAAWIATAPGGPGDPARQQPDPEPVEVFEPAVVVTDTVSPPKLVGLVGAGMLLGWGAARRRRR